MTPELMREMAKELRPYLVEDVAAQGVGYKHDASGTPISVGYVHGPNGNFTWPGVDPVVFHTTIGSRGIIGQLPTRSSVYQFPTYQTITGVTADVGSEKTNVCDDAPVAGLIKGCMVSSVFGRYERSTHEVEINRLGQRNDRADPMDLRIVGTPMAQSGLFAGPNADPRAPGNLLGSEMAHLLWQRNVSMHRLLSKQLWRGNPANNTAGGGYKEMTGIASLVTTGYKDAQTGATCAALDSIVHNMAYRRLDASGSGDAYLDIITYIFMVLENLADDTGVSPVRWVMAMRPELFQELVNVWVCAYLTYRCAVDGNERLNIDGAEQVRMRNEMLQGKYLLVGGRRVEVVLDQGIAFTSNTTNASVTSGCFASDIYILPMSVVGGESVMFLEYFDQGNADIREALGEGGILGRVEGPFLTVMKQKNFCVQWQTKIEPRLVLRTPWLAARIQNVQYCPTMNARQPFPEDPYHKNGGLTSREAPSYYRVWAS